MRSEIRERDRRCKRDHGAAEGAGHGTARRLVFVLALLLGLLTFVPATGRAQADEIGITHGPLSGEVTDTAVTLWARAGGAGTLVFDVTLADDGELVTTVEVEVDEETDFAGKARVEELTPATAYAYSVRQEGDGTEFFGTFTTAPASDEAAPLRFVFGACLGGQGYCRNPETGWAIFDTMAAREPDFFVMVGDGVYVDSACPVDEGRNVPGAEEVATDLAGFYGRYKYHLEDPAYASFLANTPIYVTWDDHEIRDNFGGPELMRINPRLLDEGRKAFVDYWPLDGSNDAPIYRKVSYGAQADLFILDTRSYRDPLVNWDPSPVNGVHKTMLGADQLAWLRQELAASDATWKIIVTSVPLGYPTGFPQPQVEGRDGWANGGDRSGYETEMMRLLFFMEANDIDNVIFVTGDTHWPFAIEYDPDQDGTANFLEVGASPLAAIPLAPGQVDQTFGPEVLYAEGEFMGELFNFGEIEIDDAGELTVRIVDQRGEERFSETRTPVP